MNQIISHPKRVILVKNRSRLELHTTMKILDELYYFLIIESHLLNFQNYSDSLHYIKNVKEFIILYSKNLDTSDFSDF